MEYRFSVGAEHDGFICIILSGANGEGIPEVDGRAIPVDVMTPMHMFFHDKCPQLVNQPTMFFLITEGKMVIILAVILRYLLMFMVILFILLSWLSVGSSF